MNKLASRRAFLRGQPLRQPIDAIRPPGEVADAFYDLCTQCSDCATACPENIISQDEQGWPVVNLSVSQCTFCGDCANACQTDALRPELVEQWTWQAHIATSCLSKNGITCRACQDACDANALRFRLQPKGRSEPVLDTEACTGCGSCASVCPADAVGFQRRPQPLSEVAP